MPVGVLRLGLEEEGAIRFVPDLPPARIVEPLRQRQQLICRIKRRTLSTTGKVAGELTPGDADKLDRVAHLETELACAPKGCVRFTPRIARRGRQRVAEGDLQLEFLPPAVVVVSDLVKQREAAV